jgi:Sensors of blue-light using FAD
MSASTPPAPSGPLHRVLYVATARKPLSREELAALLEKSRLNNERDGVTGMMLYRDGLFIQALEGPAAAVSNLMGRIRKDPRISSCDVIDEGDAEERIFAEWRMAFRNLDDPGLASHPGFSDFMNMPRAAVKSLPSDPANYWSTLDFYRRQL